ncbi:WD domain G-beta repeat uncharacterized protein [Ureibacillus xyleni]|uniref:WD domain G-beta repeat uncharacterized protein n=1 Tax=Ureibacillus xyleni TaxID=614648 RepID=A0A285RAM3_9BACL|nr:Ig-like domain-containing protein [Ureibacillus xyleni]SOB90739.1 WD domain G-beta repeat uncharacterized protein [Ureibacillus xyleni]
MKKIFSLLIVLSLCLQFNIVSASEVSTLQQVATINNSSTVTSVDYSKDDLFIITGSTDGKVSVWNADSGKIINSFEVCNCSGPIHVKYSPDNSMIATADTYGKIKLWDTTSGNLIKTLSTTEGQGKPINDIVFNVTGSVLYSANVDRNSITLWDVSKGTTIEEYSFNSEPKTIVYNPKKLQLAVGLANGSVNIRHSDTGAYIKEVTNLMDGHSVEQLDFTPDYQYLFGISSKIDQTQPYMLDVSKNYEKVTLTANEFNIQPADSEWLGFSFSNDGKYLAAVTSEGNTLNIFDVQTRALIASVLAGVRPEAVAFSHDHDRIFAGKTIFDSTTLPTYQYKGIVAVPESDTIRVGEPLNLNVFAIHHDGRKEQVSSYQVTSSNTDVLKIMYGKLIAIKDGTSTVTVDNGTFKTSIKVYVNNFKELEKKINQAPNRTWVVKFNAPVDISSVNKTNVYVTNKNKEIVEVNYSLKSSSEVQLTPKQNYTSGETYTIWVKEIKSKSNQTIKQFTKMDFQIK